MDAVIQRLGEVQEGNVARWQLLAAGVSDRAIGSRLRRGFLVRVRSGVYTVGPRRRTFRARCWVAVLVGGPHAVLSHLAALCLWGVRKAQPSVIDVTCPERHRAGDGIRFHVETLPADEVTGELGLPVTTAVRSVFDASRYLQPAQTEAAVNEIEALQLWSAYSLLDLLRRHPRRPGGAVLRGILGAERIGKTRVHEGTETEFVAFLDAHGLPRGKTNRTIGDGPTRYEADTIWEDRMVNVELDSRWHETLRARAKDRRRDRELAAQGWTVIRLTSADLRLDPEGVAATLRELLGGDGRGAA